MKTELKHLSPTRKQIDVEIQPEVVRAAYDRISDRYAQAANVPGFRPGHAPRTVVRTRFKDHANCFPMRFRKPSNNTSSNRWVNRN
ncbi:MAG: hypothetical protein DMF71_17080 [Acidobacteria bacterium]|nr:MAG: hypothetical protein DMF71_17080 [Acidobacteriota bacterium]